MERSEILKFLKPYGFDDAKKINSNWRGKEVWAPGYQGIEVAKYGQPIFVFVENGKPNISTVPEAFEYIDDVAVEVEEEEEE